MGRKIKLLALDLDGTLLNEEKKITPRTWAALERARAQGLNRPDLIDCLELLERCALARKDYELAYACAAQRRELS